MIPRSVALHTLRAVARAPSARRAYTSRGLQRPLINHSSPRTPTATIQCRFQSNKTLADEKIEDITELFATAQDEFEIAFEETEKVSVYAEEDRTAAREEFEKMKAAFKEVVEGEDKELAEEVQRRIGQRVKELEQGIERMEEMAKEQD